MPKRFTDTEKWRDAWFHQLTWRAKVLWLYLCDSCDNAGFWEITWSTAKHETGVKDIKKALPELNSRIRLDGQFIWIRRFLMFQKNWPLKNTIAPHRQIIELLRSREHLSEEINLILNGDEPEHRYEGIQLPLLKGNQRVVASRKYPIGIGKGKGKGIGKGKEELPKKQEFLEFVLLTNQEHEKLVERLGKKSAIEYIERLNNYIGSTGKKYKSHYHTILNWINKDKDNAGAKNTKNQPQRTEHKRDFGSQESQYGETIEV